MRVLIAYLSALSSLHLASRSRPLRRRLISTLQSDGAVEAQQPERLATSSLPDRCEVEPGDDAGRSKPRDRSVENQADQLRGIADASKADPGINGRIATA